MKQLLILSLTLAVILAVTFVFLVKTERQYDDCQFECNHQATQISHLRELNDYVPILEQLLNSQQLAKLKACSEMIRQKRWKNHEAIEEPILNEEELRKFIK